jgi:hypothetical protein
MRVAWSAAALLVTLPGCAIVADLDSSGYRLADAGDARGVGCDADAMCSALSLGCVAAKDCAVGQICCLALTSSSSASVACEMGSTCSFAQLCQTDVECPGAQCISQQCSFGGPVFTFHACGNVLTCSPGP